MSRKTSDALTPIIILLEGRERELASAQATIASLTAEKDAAERRVVELEAERSMAARIYDDHVELTTALSQERTARVEAERERDEHEAEDKVLKAMVEASDLGYMAHIDRLQESLEESRTARQAAEALVEESYQSYHKAKHSFINDPANWQDCIWSSCVANGAKFAALTPTAPEQQEETPMNITIYINRNAFTVTKPFLSGAELRYLPTPAVAEDYDLWEVIPGESNDVKITSAAVVEMRDRQQFFTSPSHINEG